jgi:hypothetical protein
MAVRTEATEAPALVVLRRTLDARWPQRSRMADRILGQDGDHARGDALDVSSDPVDGPDLERLAAALVRDPRTVVVRWCGRVAEPGVAGGAWRPDPSGSEGGHAAHLHLSIDARRRAWVGPWPEQCTDGDTDHGLGSLDADRARTVRDAPRALPVLLYGASWCGACHAAADALRDRAVPFVFKDIEQTLGARAEMENKLTQAGLPAEVLPVLDVAGRIVVGVRPAQLDEALSVAGYAATPPPGSRLHAVTCLEASTADLRGTHEAMRLIAQQWGALDRRWFAELMSTNPHKARDEHGSWRALREGERLRIPAAWPARPAGSRTTRLLPPDTNGPHSTERVYRVATAETPASIARKFGVTPVTRPRWLLELSEVNPQMPHEGSADLRLGEELRIPDAWPPQQVTLSDLRSAKAAPLVAYFRSLGADAEGAFRRYRNTLRPYFLGFGESADSGIFELAAGGIYVAVPGASGPLGWRQRTAAELRLEPAAVAQLVPVTFWVEPFSEPWPAGPAETGRVDDEDSFPTPGFFAGGEGP